MSYLLANETALRALGKALGFESINTVLDPSNAETVAAFGRACECAADDLRAMMLADAGPGKGGQ